MMLVSHAVMDYQVKPLFNTVTIEHAMMQSWKVNEESFMQWNLQSCTYNFPALAMLIQVMFLSCSVQGEPS